MIKESSNANLPARIVRAGTVFLAVFLSAATLGAQDFVYKTVLLQAAPGKLLDLIDLLKEDMARHNAYGIDKPYLMRHSQGDKWDLLMIIPAGNIAGYYAQNNMTKRAASHSLDKRFGDAFYDYIASHEEFFVVGPTQEMFRNAFEGFGYYHVEMFVALPGKQKELLRQRQMENVYLKEIGRPQNLIFRRVAGSRWDAFTVGFYRDIKHFAGSADVAPDAEEKAAVKAGFKGAGFIGSYLRELISEHHDTLAGAVRPKN